ncbi:SWIM zinc finger family protein [Fimbriiglobus ruber]|uniref:SWF/SNF family helicase n=1 Tax=Fimbriiglobus ruber TaxID=1908690 RepID=A0A225E9G3_9BACT|nr:SWIM zinc finger family protein [Fimbriiglobus ruber]OWK47378.1 SWF/SNF family helicase [Fimbriiglobus ruber]
MWWEYSRYPKSTPRKAVGGIKSQSKRGSFGESWWAKRWIAVIESFDVGGRLQRGRSYARGGQVLSIDVTPGHVAAKVQGSAPQPYKVSIEVAKLTDADWAKVVKALSVQAKFAAKLLAGELPSEVEQLAADAGVSLFPAKRNDLKTSCSCPDYSNPCKHIAAVYYLLGERFDRDPFLLFRLRGLDREALFAKLGASTPPPPPEAPKVARKPKAPARAAAASEPLPANAVSPSSVAPTANETAAPADPRQFWSVGELPTDLLAEINSPSVTAALPKRLGAIPFWRGDERFLDAMETAYRAASVSGANVVMGTPAEETTPTPQVAKPRIVRKPR